jgi:hypothetical protein
MASASPARDAVFGTGELVENILYFLTTKQVLSAQRVCKSWQFATVKSKTLKQRLFRLAQQPQTAVVRHSHPHGAPSSPEAFARVEVVPYLTRPNSDPTAGISVSELVAVNPLIINRAINPFTMVKDGKTVWPRFAEIINVSNVKAFKSFLQEQSAHTLTMFVTQPPLGIMRLVFAWIPHRSPLDSTTRISMDTDVKWSANTATIYDKAGVRISHILDIIEEEIVAFELGARQVIPHTTHYYGYGQSRTFATLGIHLTYGTADQACKAPELQYLC